MNPIGGQNGPDIDDAAACALRPHLAHALWTLRDEAAQQVSNGSVVWFPKGTTYGLKVGWAKFDEIMKDKATKFEKR